MPNYTFMILGIVGVSICAIFVSLLLKKYISSRPGKHVVAKLAWGLFSLFITCIGAIKIAGISCDSLQGLNELGCAVYAATRSLVVFSIIFGVLSGTLFYKIGERKWSTTPLIIAVALIFIFYWTGYLNYIEYESLNGQSFNTFFSNLTQAVEILLVPLGAYVLSYLLTGSISIWWDRRHVKVQIDDAKLPASGGTQ